MMMYDKLLRQGQGRAYKGLVGGANRSETKLTSTRAGKKPLIEYMRRKNKIKE